MVAWQVRGARVVARGGAGGFLGQRQVTFIKVQLKVQNFKQDQDQKQHEEDKHQKNKN